MFIDNSTLMADEQTTTTSGASTSYIDTLAAGDAYVGCWFVVQVGATAYAAGAHAPAVSFQLQTSPASNFTDAGTETLVASATFLAAALTADTIVYAARIPAGVKRYIRGYRYISNYSANTVYFSAATTSMYIVTDIDVNEIPGAGATT